MLSRYTLIFLRQLRTPARRTSENSFRRIIASNTSVSEDELNKLVEEKQQQNDNVSSLSKLDVPSIDISDVEVPPELELIKMKKKTKRKLQDFIFKFENLEDLTQENQEEFVVKAVTPLSKFSYQKQLRIKQAHCEQVLKKLRTDLKTVDAPVNTTLDRLLCPMENIIPSPDLYNYRNKDKFSVHTGVDGNPKTVGYFIGLPKDPLMRCVSPAPLVNIRESHKLVAKHFQKFIEASPYKTCVNFKEGGVWRELTVRSNLKGELMAVIIIFPDMTADEKEELKNKLHHYFISGEGSECNLSSLYFQACPRAKCSRETAPFELIFGEPYLIEECLGKQFRISPDSFFQSNTRGAELLFDAVGRMAELSSLTTLLDVCCGTGIMSILLGSNCRGSLGVDTVSSCIEDAKVNAKINNVKNANYICGKIEKVLPVLAKELQDSSDVVAIVNPARSGLHPSVIRTLRNCLCINKIIYVTCNPEGNVLKNLQLLGSTITSEVKYLRKIPDIGEINPKLGPPFSVKYAIPVDLFPHTAHVEFILMLDRVYNY